MNNNSGRTKNAGANNTLSSGPLGYVMGKGIVAQLLLSLVVAIAVYILFMSLELVYKSFVAVAGTKVNVLALTVNAEDKPREFEQNPAARRPMLLPMSDNERTGVEFSYAFFLWVNPASFGNDEGLKHIFHKGNPTPFPLMAPGVFMKNNTNTLRVYMNSSKTWNNYIDIDNIPVKKWVHVAIVAHNNTIEIYINGNLSQKLNIDGGVLYQNFGNLYLFSQRPTNLNATSIPSLNGENFTVFGTYSGSMSRFCYYSYALSYTEIQALINEGPNKQVETNSADSPPYLKDDWWTASYDR